MKNVSFLALIGATLVAGVATAQVSAPLSFARIANGTDIKVATLAASVEPDGLAVSPNGQYVYLMDSISAYDGYIVKDGANSFARLATEAQLYVPIVGAPSASANDTGADATHVFINIFTSSSDRCNIFRVPHGTLTANFAANAVRMVNDAGSIAKVQIAADGKNSRLFLFNTDTFIQTTSEDIFHVPYTANDATPTAFVTETDLENAMRTAGAASALTNASDRDTLDDVNITDATVQTDGDLILAHGFGNSSALLTSAFSGTLLRVTETGTVSIFRSAANIKTAAGYLPSVNIGNIGVATMPAGIAGGSVLIVVTLTSDEVNSPGFVAVVSGDGATQRLVATRLQLQGALSGAAATGAVTGGTGPGANTLFAFDAKFTFPVDANGDLYFHRQGTSNNDEANGIYKLSGLGVTSAYEWMSY